MDPDDLPEGRLRDVLSAAAAPGHPSELAGEDAAVAVFRREYRPVVPRPHRLIAVASAAALAIFAGGTAVAATTGRLPLPAPVRSWLDDGSNSSVTTAPAPRPTSPGHNGPETTGAPGATGLSAVELCRIWVARAADPRARPVTGGERRELARLAGSEPAIDAYCHTLLGLPAPSSSASATAGASGSAGNNGNGNGNSNGSGSGNGSGNGGSDKKAKPSRASKVERATVTAAARA